MKEHDLKPARGASRQRRRVGRGDGSGRGSYSGRGMKGQNSRSGGGVRPGFMGGQIPLIKSLPMLRGFTNIFRVQYAEVRLEKLARFGPGSRITPETLVEARIIKNERRPVKVLGNRSLTVPLTVAAHKVTAGARAAIEAAGGQVELL